MHIPDGFFNGGTSAVFGVVAAGGVAVAVKKASVEMEDKHVPLAGLVAAFIFAVQMLNFPVAIGTSGHLLGGALAAILVGPWLGVLCVSVVLLVQALFADGGLTALGLNVTDMAIVTAVVGYGLFVLVRNVLPRSKGSVVVATFNGALISVVASAAVFSLQYAIGGAGDAATGTVFTAMVGTHVLIGIGEGVISALTVSAVLASRPDLVYGAAPVLASLSGRAIGARAVTA